MATTQRAVRVRLAAGSVTVALAAVCCLLFASIAPARTGPIKISRSGQIGALRLNASTSTSVIRHWGTPGYTTSGNIAGPGSGYPNYTLLGYGCSQHGGATFCATNFYVSRNTDRLESFSTSSSRFVLFGGVRVGMSADIASQRERQPDVAGCGEFIHVPNPDLDVQIDTHGGDTAAGIHLHGGRVEAIGIDEKQLGVGVNFC
jgi:hypothetical protein